MTIDLDASVHTENVPRFISTKEEILLDSVIKGELLVVNAALWHKLVYSMLTGHAENYLHQQSMKQFGLLRGGQTPEEWRAMLEETKTFIGRGK